MSVIPLLLGIKITLDGFDMPLELINRPINTVNI